MDSSDCRQTQQPPADGAGGDWRSQLQRNSRERIVNAILDTLKKHLPSSRQEEVEELWITARKLEERTYNAATSQIDYVNRISLRMLLTMESKSNAPDTMSIAIPSNSGGISKNPQDPASSDINAQTGISELQEEVYLKIKTMEDLHYSEIHGIYQKVCSKIQQHDSLPLQAKSDGAVWLSLMKPMLEHIMQCFRMSRLNAQTFCNDKLPGLEKQIMGNLKQNSQLQSVLVQGSSVSSFQPKMMNSAQISLNLELGQGNAPPETPSTSSVSTALTNISEAEKEFYQKVKDYYCHLRELKNICQELSLYLEKLKKMLEKMQQMLEMMVSRRQT